MSAPGVDRTSSPRIHLHDLSPHRLLTNKTTHTWYTLRVPSTRRIPCRAAFPLPVASPPGGHFVPFEDRPPRGYVCFRRANLLPFRDAECVGLQRNQRPPHTAYLPCPSASPAARSPPKPRPALSCSARREQLAPLDPGRVESERSTANKRTHTVTKVTSDRLKYSLSLSLTKRAPRISQKDQYS